MHIRPLLLIFVTMLSLSHIKSNELGFIRRTIGPKAEGVTRVVAFGDSITGNRPAQNYRDNHLKYADLLGLMMEARLGVGKVEIINSGWAGDRTFPQPTKKWPGAVGRLEVDLVRYQPDIVVILIGGNDKPTSPEDAETTRKNLVTIYQTAKDTGAKVLALQYHNAQPNPKEPEKAWGYLAEKSEPLIAAAAKEVGVPVHSLAPDFDQAAQEHGAENLVAWPDGVHLKPLGEIIVARSIFNKLDDLGWLPPVQ